MKSDQVKNFIIKQDNLTTFQNLKQELWSSREQQQIKQQEPLIFLNALRWFLQITLQPTVYNKHAQTLVSFHR